MKLLVMQFLASRYFFSGAKYSPQHPGLRQPQSAILAMEERQRSVPINEISKIIVLYNSVFTFFDPKMGFRIS
jgi:hypothetical protein